jgi:hypothetical protein
MATIKKKAGLGSTIGGILGGPLGFLGGRSMDRKNQAIKNETIQPAKNGKKVMKKAGMHKMPDGSMMKNSKMKPKANYGKSMMKTGGKCKNGC